LANQNDIIRAIQRLESEKRRHVETIDSIIMELTGLLTPDTDKPGAVISDWKTELETWKTKRGQI